MIPIIKIHDAAIPALGFGTFRMPGDDVLRIVPEALRLGFRHIDTAQIYGNEAEVGEAIEASSVPRDDIFLTTKVWVDNYRRESFLASVDESLRRLRTDHVDLLLLHWPNEAVPLAEQIGALNEVAKAGKARHVGVSNFTTALMREAAGLSERPLVTNQIEFHPYIDQRPVAEEASQLGMALTGYYAMADGQVFADPLLIGIAREKGRSVAQIVLRWVVQSGVIALSKTVGAARAAENVAIFDFELSADEMRAISALARPDGRIVSPEGLAPAWDVAA